MYITFFYILTWTCKGPQVRTPRWSNRLVRAQLSGGSNTLGLASPDPQGYSSPQKHH